MRVPRQVAESLTNLRFRCLLVDAQQRVVVNVSGHDLRSRPASRSDREINIWETGRPGKRWHPFFSACLATLLEKELPRAGPQRIGKVSIAGDSLQLPLAQSLEQRQADRQRNFRILYQGEHDPGPTDPIPGLRDLFEDLLFQMAHRAEPLDL